jgi:hypothetical protein
MTNRDLAGVAAGVVAIAALMTVVILLRERGDRPKRGSVSDAALSSEPTPLPAIDPEPEPDDTDAAVPDGQRVPIPVTPGHPRESSSVHAQDAGRDASSSTVLRAQNLLIHPVGHDKLCIDYSTKKDTLHLFSCHGHKNQRWTAAEDVAGAIRLMNGEGGCVIVQGTTKDGEPAMTLGTCGASAARFKHFEEHRLQEAQTGKCVGAHRFEKGTALALEACDASDPGQAWALAAQ